jgi:hypothetical protein
MTFSNQMTNIDPEKFIAELNKLKMTSEEHRVANTQEWGEVIAKSVVGIILLVIFSTIIWSVLTFIFGLNITWLKVFGAYFLFNFLKNIIVKSFKN